MIHVLLFSSENAVKGFLKRQKRKRIVMFRLEVDVECVCFFLSRVFPLRLASTNMSRIESDVTDVILTHDPT